MKTFILLLALVAVALAQYGSSYGSNSYGYGSSSNNGMYTDPMTGRQYTQQQVSNALQMCGSSSSYGSSYGNSQMYNPSSSQYYPSSSTYSYGRK